LTFALVFAFLAMQFLGGHRFPDLKRLGLPCSAEGRISDIAVDSANALAFLASFDKSSDGHLVIGDGRLPDIKTTFSEPAAALISVQVMTIDLRWAKDFVKFDIALLTHFKQLQLLNLQSCSNVTGTQPYELSAPYLLTMNSLEN